MEKKYIFYISILVLVVVSIAIFLFILTRKKRCTENLGCPLVPLETSRRPGCPKYSLPNFPFNFGGFTRDMGTKVPSQNNPFIGINTEIWTFFSFEMTPDKKDLNITYKYDAGLDDAIKRLQCTNGSKNPTKVWLGGLASNMPGGITPLKDFIVLMFSDPDSDALLNKFVSRVKEALGKYKCHGVSIDWEVNFEDPIIKKDAEKIWSGFVLLISRLHENKIPVRMEVLPYENGHYFTREIIKKLDPYVEYWDLMFYDYAAGNDPGYNSPLDGLKCTLENYWMGTEGLNISPSKICVILPIFGLIWPNPTISPSPEHGWDKDSPHFGTPELASYQASPFLPGGNCQDSRGEQTWKTTNGDEDHLSPSVAGKWFYDFNNFPDINKKYVTYSETHDQPTFSIPIGVDPGIIDPDDSSKKLYGKTQGYVGTFEDERSMAAKTDYLISVYKKYGSFGGILVWSLNNDKILPDKTIEYVMVKVISKTLSDKL